MKRRDIPSPAIVDGIRRFVYTRMIEAAIPPRIRKGTPPLEGIERIGGLTNRNYKLKLGEETLVLRLPGRGTGRFIDRSSERANQEAAARAGFTPSSLYFDRRTGVKISSYLQDAHALDALEAKRPDRSAEIAAFLNRFHGSQIRFVKEFNPFRMIRIYERVARTRFARFYDGFGFARDRILSFEAPLRGMCEKKVACHNDLVPENILAGPAGLTLIDWEYSGMNDPSWDIASFLLESDFGPREEAHFLSSYFGGTVPDRAIVGVNAYKLLQDFLWSLWSLLQGNAARNPQKSRYYREYGDFRYHRGIVRLESAEYELGLSGKTSVKGRRT